MAPALKLQLPYYAGSLLSAYADPIPPDPSPARAGNLQTRCHNSRKRGIEYEEDTDKIEQSPVEQCRRRYPHTGSMGGNHLELEVVVPLQIGDATRAQVFTVVLCGSSGEHRYSELQLSPQTLLVGKAFDPLYYCDGDDHYLDAFRCVE